MKEKKYNLLTLSERKSIEQMLRNKDSIGRIALCLGRHKTTVSREIKRKSIYKMSGSWGSSYNDCKYRIGCGVTKLCSHIICNKKCRNCRLCSTACERYEYESCLLLDKSPYVCNGCEKKMKCTLEKCEYKATDAHKETLRLQKEARNGVCISKEEIKRLDDIVSPLIKNGQSPYHIISNNKSKLMLSEKTLYRYLDDGLFTARNIHLRCKVKMKPRKISRPIKIDTGCRIGRTYEDYKNYIASHPDTPTVEIDSVIGKKGGGEKLLLTIHFPHSELMLAFIRDANNAQSVEYAFLFLKEILGYELFTTLFPIILTDNGPEFSDPLSIEKDVNGVIWTKLFYCDPYSSWQKPSVENNHRMIRMISPKGKSMNFLEQDDVSLMMSHINSYKRKALGGKSPIEIFDEMYGSFTRKQLGIDIIESNKIILKPSLFKK